MASNLLVIDSTLLAMASNLLVIDSTLLAMASNLLPSRCADSTLTSDGMASNLSSQVGLHPNSDGLQPTSRLTPPY